MTQSLRSCRRRPGRLAAVALGALLATLSLPVATTLAVFPTFYSVDTLVDSVGGDGHCSLREAIQSSNGFTSECGTGSSGTADGIGFAVDGTIVLGSVLPAIDDDVNIDGTGTTVAISGNDAFDILKVNAGKTLALVGMTLTAGRGALDNAGTAHVTRVVFANDANSGDRSALVNESGQILTVTQSTFSNDGGSNVFQGGAIANFGQATVTTSTFKNDRAFGGPGPSGGAIESRGTLTVSRSTFARNSGGTYGGAINVATGSATISNSTFFKNGADLGGAIAAGSATTVVNSTFVGNTASQGTSIYAHSSNAAVKLRNTAVSGVASGPSCVTTNDGSVADGGGNLSWPDTSCPGVVADPKLDTALRNNGGPTKTLALRWNSPAIDRGSATTCQVAPVNDEDQRGGLRPVDGNHNGQPHCDIGAFEFGGIVPAAPRLRSATPSGGSESLTWRHARDALRYVVEVRKSGALVATRNTTTTVTVTVALGGGSFTWTVQACNTRGCTRSATGSFSR